jgi:soluble lytic murein transglycosylase-like protein
MSPAWIPYAHGRPAHPPAGRPFAGPWATLLIPAVLGVSLSVPFSLAGASSHVPQDHLEASVVSTPADPASSLPPQFSPTVQYWSADIHRWAADYRLPTEWIAVVMQIESCGHPSIRSRAGAAGLFQVMPFHFQPGEDPVDPSTNAARGIAYLARGYTLASGDPAATLAGYNGGHGWIGRPEPAWPPETRRYVAWGTGILHDIEAGLNPSPTLARWMDAGGERLCRLAAETLGTAP